MDKTTLEHFFRDKLENYEMPVDAGDWDIIRSRLQRRKQRKVTIYWFSASASAAAVALFFLLYRPSVTGHLPAVPAVAAVTPLSIAVPGKAQAPALANNASAVPHRILAPVPEKPLLETAHHGIPAAAPVPADTAQTVLISSQMTAEAKEEETEMPVQPAMQDTLPALPLFEETALPEQSERKKWALALLANRSGGMSAANTFDLMENLANDFHYAAAGADRNMINIPLKTTHHIPLSFGLTFRFYFTARWAVESGLVYTYLSSEYKYAGDYRLKQQLHYLGLPVNVVFRIIGSKRFSVYVSGGGMMEKGVSANYTAFTPVSRTDSRENIAVLQWSLNGQAGGGYHFSNHFSLYVEPGVRYFFPDVRQPESVRTERPFAFSLGLGVRTTF